MAYIWKQNFMGVWIVPKLKGRPWSDCSKHAASRCALQQINILSPLAASILKDQMCAFWIVCSRQDPVNVFYCFPCDHLGSTKIHSKLTQIDANCALQEMNFTSYVVLSTLVVLGVVAHVPWCQDVHTGWANLTVPASLYLALQRLWWKKWQRARHSQSTSSSILPSSICLQTKYAWQWCTTSCPALNWTSLGSLTWKSIVRCTWTFCTKLQIYAKFRIRWIRQFLIIFLCAGALCFSGLRCFSCLARFCSEYLLGPFATLRWQFHMLHL